MSQQIAYPRYLKNKMGLVAITSKDKMFAITNQGRNMNSGVCIDHYTTRKMVLKHQNDGELISREQFVRLYNQLFSATLQFIIPNA